MSGRVWANSLSAMFALSLGFPVLVSPYTAAAIERADFIKGTYAAGDGCKMLEKLATGTPRGLTTVPEVLTADGFKGWEGSCEFTKIFPHDRGKSWVAIMLCSEGMTLAPTTTVFFKDPDRDSFDVATTGQDEPQVYERCKTVPKD